MENSLKRIKYISEYIVSYENKIKSLNKIGLFDEAKMFEQFACEVCKLIFKCSFGNLNFERKNFPCVDLVSDDKKIYVQVSTCGNVPSKIKRTLNDIKDSNDTAIKEIESIYFFVVSNNSIGKVVDYSNSKKIGKIEFKKKENLITTQSLLDRAQNDFEFQLGLYELCKKDQSFEDFQSFSEALEDSKTLIRDINDTIGLKYRINIDNLINSVSNNSTKFILVTGGAGVGKSVLCRKVAESNDLFLYAKAEKILELTDVNLIWNFNINNVLNAINRKLYVFIDSLEFVADNKTKLDLLDCLFGRLQKFENVQIICSCRSSDRSAFIKIENKYKFDICSISELPDKEIELISKTFPVIGEMMQQEKYKDLLSNPFYLDCLTKIHNIECIENENDLRNIIWNEIICCGDQKNEKIVLKIVLDRAKNFLLGSEKNQYDSAKINQLVSSNILIEHNSKIRLKFDIFEDICFERYIDSLFDACRGNYSGFFDSLASLGRCVYRRLQIWIENKLFVKSNREKFLYSLLNDSFISNKWKKQIEIGVIKSRYSFDFLVENAETIKNNNTLFDFIKLTNVYGFEIEEATPSNNLITLKPIGAGRVALIDIIFDSDIYKIDTVHENEITKLISDFATSNSTNKDICLKACKILEFYIEKIIAKTDIEFYDKHILCKTAIKALLKLSQYCSEWFGKYINDLLRHLSSHHNREIRFATDSISDLICLDNGNLVNSNFHDVLKMLSAFFTENIKDESSIYYQDREFNNDWKYGINSNADSYIQEHREYPAHTSTCFWRLLHKDFWNALSWLIDFLNNCILKYKENEDVISIDVYFVDNDTHKSFYGTEKMWLTSCQEYQMPSIISDLVFSFENFVEASIKNSDADSKIKFLEAIKEKIVSKSNNIIMLSSLTHFGLRHENDVPGYALDFLSDVNLILMDCSRYSFTLDNPAKRVLEKEITRKIGLPSLGSDRYSSSNLPVDLRRYMQNAQLKTDTLRKKCYAILDYLYSITKNNKNDGVKFLQIELMDLRKSKISKINDSSYLITPTLDGEALKISEQQDKNNEPIVQLYKLVEKAKTYIENQVFSETDSVALIDDFIKFIDHPYFPAFSNFVFTLMCKCLFAKNLTLLARNHICKTWISLLKIQKKNAGIIIDSKLFKFLFEQLNFEIDIEHKNYIMNLILDSFINDDLSDLNKSEIKTVARQFLKTNKELSLRVFATILLLAEDEMNHQKYNFDYYNKKEKSNSPFFPNLIPHLSGVDHYIVNDGAKPFASKRDEIIDTFLLNQQKINLNNFEIDNYDISLLCSALDCGVDFLHVSPILKPLINKIIEIFSKKDSHYILNTYIQSDIRVFFTNALLDEKTSNDVINIMFDDVKYPLFKHEAIDFYLEVFDGLVPFYFDNYSNPKGRKYIESIWTKVEEKINSVQQENIRNELTKILIMAPTRYFSNDWSMCKTVYSYNDKMFLNKMGQKYGSFHVKGFLESIYRLHYKELFPELLPSVSNSLYIAKNNNIGIGYREMDEILKYLLLYSSYNFLNKENEIKQECDLIDAFERILEFQVDNNSEIAAVILDEFRVH